MCGGLILSCCPRNPHGHERALKEEEEDKTQQNKLGSRYTPHITKIEQAQIQKNLLAK